MPIPGRQYRLSRRDFLRVAGSAALGAPLLQGCSTPGPTGRNAPALLNHACIGVAGAGAADVLAFRDDRRVRVVALCDVDAGNLTRAGEFVHGARLYSDYRQMLRAEGSRIQSVSIAVPAHMHFATCAAAIRAGKDVCCHGPVGHDLAEARGLRRLSTRARQILVVNAAREPDPHAAQAAMWLQQKRVGLVTRVYILTLSPTADSFRYREAGEPVASDANLEWDLWLGTAPEREFVPGRYHPALWRAWQDFGTGPAMDVLQDLFQPVWRGLQLEVAVGVNAAPEAAGPPGTWPDAGRVSWTFPGNNYIAGGELAVDWYDGQARVPDRIRSLMGIEGELPRAAALVIGTEGTLLLQSGREPVLVHKDGRRNPSESAPVTSGSYADYVDACLERQDWHGNWDSSMQFSETLLLATIAWRLPGRTLQWNTRAGIFPDQPDANRWLARTYRDGWHIGPF